MRCDCCNSPAKYDARWRPALIGSPNHGFLCEKHLEILRNRLKTYLEKGEGYIFASPLPDFDKF